MEVAGVLVHAWIIGVWELSELIRNVLLLGLLLFTCTLLCFFVAPVEECIEPGGYKTHSIGNRANSTCLSLGLTLLGLDGIDDSLSRSIDRIVSCTTIDNVLHQS